MGNSPLAQPEPPTDLRCGANASEEFCKALIMESWWKNDKLDTHWIQIEVQIELNWFIPNHSDLFQLVVPATRSNFSGTESLGPC